METMKRWWVKCRPQNKQIEWTAVSYSIDYFKLKLNSHNFLWIYSWKRKIDPILRRISLSRYEFYPNQIKLKQPWLMLKGTSRSYKRNATQLSSNICSKKSYIQTIDTQFTYTTPFTCNGLLATVMPWSIFATFKNGTTSILKIPKMYTRYASLNGNWIIQIMN